MSMRTTQRVTHYSRNRWDAPRDSACTGGNTKNPDVTMRNETTHLPSPRITLPPSRPLEQSRAPALAQFGLHIAYHVYTSTFIS